MASNRASETRAEHMDYAKMHIIEWFQNLDSIRPELRKSCIVFRRLASAHDCEFNIESILNLRFPQLCLRFEPLTNVTKRPPCYAYAKLDFGTRYFPTAEFRTCVLKNPPFVRSMTCWYTDIGG
jgi:hypothetical protein